MSRHPRAASKPKAPRNRREHSGKIILPARPSTHGRTYRWNVDGAKFIVGWLNGRITRCVRVDGTNESLYRACAPLPGALVERAVNYRKAH